MSVDHIRYDLLVQDAMRGVVRRVLTDIARNGLPGEHHFYISFDTRAEGVRLSPRLKAQYPEEMTIVLQHQFWDMQITDTAFEAGLSFGGVAEKLYVPFEALKGFFDPSVQFGLEFQVAVEGAADTGDAAASGSATPVRLDPAKQLPASTTQDVAQLPVAQAKKADMKKAEAKAETPAKSDPTPQKSGGGEVVRLDRFRKK